jgi:inner membrane transporter RhtA
MAAMNVDRTERGPSALPSLTALTGRTFGAIPPRALVLLGIVSVQVGSALAKHLFSAVGSLGTVSWTGASAWRRPGSRWGSR